MIVFPMKTPIRQFWENNADFSDRPIIDFDADPNFSEATNQLSKLLADFPSFTSLAEIGSGSGEYLNYLSSKFSFKNITGSDVESPRLHRSKAEFPHLVFEQADALEMVKKHNKQGTIFLAMNMLGSLEYAEISELFSQFKIPGTAFMFCSRGLTPEIMGTSAAKKGHLFDHNIIDLLRGSNLEVRHCQIKYDYNEQKRAVYIITAIVM